MTGLEIDSNFRSRDSASSSICYRLAYDLTQDGLSSIDTSSFRSERTGSSSFMSNRSLDAADPNRDGAHPVFLPVEVQSGLGYQTQLSTGSEMTDRSGLTEASERRSDLEEAIKAGDWKSVGATAALIAGNTTPYRDRESDDEFNASTFEDEDLNSSSTSVSSTEHGQLREMEQLVEAGDWQAVMQAASRYETATASDVESLAGPDGESGRDSDSGSHGERSQSPEPSLYDTSVMSSAESQSEYRAEIEDLLSKVMPDELENVDEMLLQFRGREDELLATLRTMRDRKESSSDSGSGSPPSSGSYEAPLSAGEETKASARVSVYEESAEGSLRGEDESIATEGAAEGAAEGHRRQSSMEFSDPLLGMSDPGDPP